MLLRRLTALVAKVYHEATDLRRPPDHLAVHLVEGADRILLRSKVYKRVCIGPAGLFDVRRLAPELSEYVHQHAVIARWMQFSNKEDARGLVLGEATRSRLKLSRGVLGVTPATVPHLLVGTKVGYHRRTAGHGRGLTGPVGKPRWRWRGWGMRP